MLKYSLSGERGAVRAGGGGGGREGRRRREIS